jgi:hypothetical protein
MGKLLTLTLVRDSLPRGRSRFAAILGSREKRGEGNAAVSDNPLLERVDAVAEGFSSLTLDVGVCLRADCAPNEWQKPFLPINIRMTPDLA